MTQLRTVSMIFAIIASVVALVAGFILFFVIEPPFLASIFLASASIAIGCFILTGIAAYFALNISRFSAWCHSERSEESRIFLRRSAAQTCEPRGTIADAYAVRHGGPGAK